MYCAVTGLIQNLNEDSNAMATCLLGKPTVNHDASVNMAIAAEESCQIVGQADFYPARKVGLDYIERYTPVMENRLVLAGERLASLLNRAFR